MKIVSMGVDVSKEKIDVCLHTTEKQLKQIVLTNTMEAIKDGFKKMLKAYQLNSLDVLVCAEYTGQYTYPLSCACTEMGMDLWIENPAQIKMRSGVQ
jgi:transposase